MAPGRHPAKTHERVRMSVPGFACNTGTFIELNAEGTVVRFAEDNTVIVAFEYRVPISHLQVVRKDR